MQDIRRINADTRAIARIRNGMGAHHNRPKAKGTTVNQEVFTKLDGLDARLTNIELLLSRVLAGLAAVLGMIHGDDPPVAPPGEFRNGIGEPDQLGCARYLDKIALNAQFPYAASVSDRILAHRVLEEWPEKFTPEQAEQIAWHTSRDNAKLNFHMYRDGKGNTIDGILVLEAQTREEEAAELAAYVAARADDHEPPANGPDFSPHGG